MATIYPIPVNRLLLSFKIAALIFIMAIFSTSCNKQEDFDINELDDLYFNYDKGLLFGLDLGNRWRSVKQSPHKSFTLHDCSSPWYIKQWNPSELLGIAINVDDENNIELFTSTLYVLKKNEQK